MNAPAAPMRSRELTALADCIGWEAVEQLVRAFGGQRITVPKRQPPDNHRLIAALGYEKTALLVHHYADTTVYLPNIAGREMQVMRQMEVLRLAAQTPRPSVNDIAQAVGLSYRGVQKIIARHCDGDSQPSLLDLL